MADTEPKTAEVLEQKPEETKVEATETAETSSDEPASTDATPAAADAGAEESAAAGGDAATAASGDDAAEDVDDSHQRYTYRRPQRDETRYNGVVRWFRADKGNFGFISVECEEKGNPDAHVHGDNVECDAEGNIQILEEGQKCSFTLLTRPPPKTDPNGETRYTAKNVIPGEKQKREKKIVKKYKGRCVFFNNAKDKKYGFIKIEACDEFPGTIDVYVRQDSVKGGKGGLVEDQEVVCEIQSNEYDKDNGEKEVKLSAVNVVPGKAPPADPEKDIVFSGTCVRWIERKEDGPNNKLNDKSFGFIRLDNDATREVMVHNSKILSGVKSLVVTQKCRFKISKRKDRQDPTKKLRESAIEVSPGDIPVKKILTGVVRFFDEEKGFGFISRQGHNDKDYYCRVESIIGKDKSLEEKQTVTFVAAPSNRPGKPRAVEVRPGKKAVNGEVAELAPEETPFDAYLPGHTEAAAAVKKAKKKKSNLPLYKQIEQDDTMTEDEKAAALKKDFNYRKRMRRKRALAREESPSSREDKTPAVAPAPVAKPKQPTPAPQPVAAPAPPQQQQQSKKSKKSKKKQQQQEPAAPAPVVEAPAPVVQTNSKKKKAPKQQQQAKQQQQQAEKEQKKQQQQQQQQAAAAAVQQGNKKKPKRRKNAKKKSKGRADKQSSSSSEEEDVIDAAFNANKAARDRQNAASASFFAVVYNYILSFCKTPAPQRKLRR